MQRTMYMNIPETAEGKRLQSLFLKARLQQKNKQANHPIKTNIGTAVVNRCLFLSLTGYKTG